MVGSELGLGGGRILGTVARCERSAVVPDVVVGARWLRRRASSVRGRMQSGVRAGAARRTATGTTPSPRLEEVPVSHRAPIIKAYLSKRAYSKSLEYEARESFGVSPDATLDELDELADRYPVFRIADAP